MEMLQAAIEWYIALVTPPMEDMIRPAQEVYFVIVIFLPALVLSWAVVAGSMYTVFKGLEVLITLVWRFVFKGDA